MTREEFLTAFHDLLEIPGAALKGDEQLGELEEWDSLAVLNFIALVDERCGIAVPPKQIVACKTVNDLYQLTVPAA